MTREAMNTTEVVETDSKPLSLTKSPSHVTLPDSMFDSVAAAIDDISFVFFSCNLTSITPCTHILHIGPFIKESGRFVVVVDNEDRENEGDLIIAAEDMTKDKMAFMVRYTRLVC